MFLIAILDTLQEIINEESEPLVSEFLASEIDLDMGVACCSLGADTRRDTLLL
jgi:hypothetical protein